MKQTSVSPSKVVCISAVLRWAACCQETKFGSLSCYTVLLVPSFSPSVPARNHNCMSKFWTIHRTYHNHSFFSNIHLQTSEYRCFVIVAMQQLGFKVLCSIFLLLVAVNSVHSQSGKGPTLHVNCSFLQLFR